MFCINCIKWYIKSTEEAEDKPCCIDCQEVITRYKLNYQLGKLIDDLEGVTT